MAIFLIIYIFPSIYGFSIVAAGDIDCKGTAKELLSDIVKQSSDAYFWLGDLSYDEAPGGEKCFLDLLKVYSLFGKSYIAIGNHDIPNSQQYLNAFHLNNTYYTKDFLADGLKIRVLFLNTEETILPDTEQYNWIEAELDTIWNDGNELYDFTIIASHRPLYGVTDVMQDPSYDSLVTSFEPLHSLFKSRGVDLVLSGHHHVYYRMLPFEGIQYITVGTGGAPQHHFFMDDEKPDNVAIRFAGIHGFLYLTFSPSQIHGTFVDIPDNNKLDDFILKYQ